QRTAGRAETARRRGGPPETRDRRTGPTDPSPADVEQPKYAKIGIATEWCFSPACRGRGWTSPASGPDPAQAKPDPAQAKYAKNGIAMETLFSPDGGRRLGHRVQAQRTGTIRP